MSKGHDYFMQRALALALKGKGRVHPNPLVGCVIVKNGKIVGEGYHPYYGGPHAEIVAIQKAKKKAKGATAYITLEPCVHWGKTPPCAPQVIQSGIKAAYIAMQDPNPVVQGRGITSLKKAGINVNVGLFKEDAKKLNRPYLVNRIEKRPFITLKMAMTFDGKIATAKGDAKWISNPASRQWVHKLRSGVDAILVGRRTIMLDDPILNTHGRGKNPVRMVIDPQLRLVPTFRVFKDSSAETFIICSDRVSLKKARVFEENGVKILRVSLKYGKIKVKYLLRNLFKMNINQLLIEGGSNTSWLFLKENLIDEIFMVIAPKIIGGSNSIAPFGGEGFPLNQAKVLEDVSISRIGGDVILHGFVRRGRKGIQ